MDVINLVQQTNGAFVYTYNLSAWADLYDLGTGTFYSHLRDQLDDPVVLYQWDVAHGGLTFYETLANGSITFTLNPVPGDPSATILIGATIVAFDSQVPIGIDLAHTMASLLAYLNASTDPQLSQCTYAVVGNTLNISYQVVGTLGNAFPLASSVAGSTASGTTLAGGGGLLVMYAPVSDIAQFDGPYYYDVRFQDATDTILVPLFGGTVTFSPGSTRLTPL